MSNGLLSQLETYYSEVDEAQDPIRPDEVSDRMDVVRVLPAPLLPLQRSRSSRKVWMAFAAAAVALALFGTVTLLMAGNDDAVPVAMTTTPNSDSGDQSSDGWVQASWTGPGPTWVTAYPSGGFAAGSVGLPARFSLDGVNWTDEPFHPGLAGYRDLYIEGRFALANSIPRDNGVSDALWVPRQMWSGDLAWETLLEFEDGVWSVWGVGAPVMESPVEFGGVTLIMIQSPDGTPTDVYLSTTDGQTFERHRMPPMVGLVSRPEFFAYSGGFGVYQEVNRLFLSTDGVNWQIVDLPDLVPSVSGAPQIVHFYELDDRIVAQPWSDGLLWTSTDGLQWEAADEPEAPWLDVKRVLHKTPTGLALTVTRLAPNRDYEIWVSPDGADWTSVDALPAGVTVSDTPVFSVAGESVFLLLPKGEDAAVWVRTLPIGENE